MSVIGIKLHRAASVFIDDEESGLCHDYDIWLENPALMNRSISIAITVLKIPPMRT